MHIRKSVLTCRTPLTESSRRPSRRARCEFHGAVLSQSAMRSNSLPSGSANVVQRTEHLVTSRIRDAPRATSRCDSASKVLLMRTPLTCRPAAPMPAAYARSASSWPDDGDDLFQALLKCPPGQRSAGLDGITVAPGMPLQLPADLVLIVGRQRQQGRPPDHAFVLAKLDRPPAAWCQHALVLGYPLLQDHAHGRFITDPVHRRSEPPRHLSIAVGAQRSPGVVGSPLAKDQALGHQLLGH